MPAGKAPDPLFMRRSGRKRPVKKKTCGLKDRQDHETVKNTDAKAAGKSLAVLFLCLALLLAACGGEPREEGPLKEEAPSGAEEASSPDPYGEPWYGESGIAASPEEGSAAHRALARKNQVQMEGAARITNYYGTGRAAEKDYTVMIYMVGSNLESVYGAASSDLAEIEKASVPYDRTNVIVYTGGAARWSSGVPSVCNNCLDMSVSDWQERIVASTEGSSDMGDPETLSSFINFCTDYYPARDYVLILWDHGGGPVLGYGSDELFRYDSLLLPELKAALDDTVFKDRKLLMAGFDACLMGSLESALLFKDYADCLVASEELEAGDGWDYSFLSVFQGHPDGKEIGKAAVEAYRDYYETRKNEFYHPDYTLSCMDLSRAEDVGASLDRLSARMEEGMEKGSFGDLSRARSSAKTFGLAAVDSRGEGYDLIDLGDFADRTKGLFGEEAAALRSALDAMVVSFCSNVEGTNGVSVYFPGDNMDLYLAADEDVCDQISGQGPYRNFISAYAERRIEASGTPWTLEDPVLDGDITLALSPRQREDMASASYTLLWECEEGQYYVVSAFNPIRPDGEGILRVPGDPELIAIVSGKEEMPEIPWSFSAFEERQEGRVFKSNYIWLSNENDPLAEGAVSASVLAAERGGGMEVLSVSGKGTDLFEGGKNTIDVSRYFMIWSFYGSACGIGRGDDGTFLPWTDWDRTDVYRGFGILLDRDVSLKKVHMSDYPGSFLVQILVTDVNGEVHPSAPVPLESPGKADYRVVTEGSDAGTFEAALYDDHAVITKFEEDKEKADAGSPLPVVIPDRIEGRPVTGIGESAFGACRMESLQIPDSVKTIAPFAFSYCWGLKEAVLPAGLSSVSSTSFTPCRSLERFVLKGDAPACSVKDGVLYSADGKTLLTWPGAKGPEALIPEGTEEIAAKAFEGSSVEKVIFPRGLKKIGTGAFAGCTRIGPFTLPSSLESLGAHAFGASYPDFSSMGGEESPVIEALTIPAGTSYVGENAFTALKGLKAIEADPGSSVFGSADGYLTNKAGDVILQAPPGRDTGIVAVPEGITGLEKGVFAGFGEATEFYLPASLIRLGEDVFPKPAGGDWQILVHCPDGSKVMEYCREKGIPCDSDTTPSRYVTREGPLGTCTYKLEGDHALFVSYKGIEAEVTVSESVEDLPVTGLGNGREKVFYYDSALSEELLGSYDYDAYRAVMDAGGSFGEADAAGKAGLKDPFADGTLPYAETGPVKRLHLPDTLVSIGSMALSGTGLEEFEVPASVTKIGDGAFSDNRFLSLTVSEKNTAYKSDGFFLTTADGKELTACAQGHTDAEKAGLEKAGGAEGEDPVFRLALPQGVERVRPFACSHMKFYGCLLELVLPDSLKEIGEEAFSSARIRRVVFGQGLETVEKKAFYYNELTELSLPSSLKRIGEGGFAANGIFREILLPDALESLGYGCFTHYKKEGEEDLYCSRILVGKSLKTLDRHSFAGAFSRAFEVSGGNETFSASEGFLLSRDGSVLVQCPDGAGEKVMVPEGVKRLGSASFYDSRTVTEIGLPDSVTSIAPSALADSARKSVVFSGKAGSPAEESVRLAGYLWKEEQE